MSGDGNDAKGKSKSKVDPAIFRMAEERDYQFKWKKKIKLMAATKPKVML